MTRATDHVTDHNELVGLLLTEATRFGYAPVSNGPFTYDDPGHIDEHNLYVDDLKAIATIAGRTFTTALPDTANHGDPGHPADHDLLRAAVTEIQGWPAWNDATGGTITEIDDYNGTGERWRVHTFTGNGTLDVSLAAQPFRVLVVAGGSGGGGEYNAGSARSGGIIEGDNTLTTGAHSVVVGAGGPGGRAGGDPAIMGGSSSLGALSVACDGSNAPKSSNITGSAYTYSPGSPGLSGGFPAPGSAYGQQGCSGAPHPTGGPPSASNKGQQGIVVVAYRIG